MTHSDKRTEKSIVIQKAPDMTTSQAMARAALKPSLNASILIDEYQGNILGRNIEIDDLARALSDNMGKVNNGDLTVIEAMLVGQATALQTIFTNLAKRANVQEHLSNYETFLTLAFKAQAQSRTTIQTLIDLKFPRQATFVRQANIAHGNQQVNNNAEGSSISSPQGRAAEVPEVPSKLLEASANEPFGMDSRKAPAPGREDSKLETLGAVYRPQDLARKEGGRKERIQRRRASHVA